MTSLMRDLRQGKQMTRSSAMKIRSLACALAAALSLAAPSAVSAGAEGPPTVVELFTSQSCYSCPPAEAFLGELAQQPGVIALEFHVDYWDDLVYGLAGRWKDVYSNPAYTRRQRAYNQAIKGRPGAYTPQMVIDGSRETVGSRRSAVYDAIEAASRDSRPRAQVSIAPGPAGALHPGPHHPGPRRREQRQKPHQPSRGDRAAAGRPVVRRPGARRAARGEPRARRRLRNPGPRRPPRPDPRRRHLPPAQFLNSRSSW